MTTDDWVDDNSGNRQRKRLDDEATEDSARLKRAKKEEIRLEAVVTAMEEVKVYSLEMLGKGKKKRVVCSIKRHGWKCCSACAGQPY